MKKYLVVISLALFTGCVSIQESETALKSMYNLPSSGKSDFDGTQHIRMSNMFCSDRVFIEMYQDTKQSKSGVVLVKAGSNTISNIGDNESLMFKIDDEIVSFESFSPVTQHDTIYYQYGASIPFSNKSYLVPESTVRRMAEANSLLVKMNLLNHTYIESKCSPMTLKEYEDKNKGLKVRITQEHVDLGNKVTAQAGIRSFVGMMESTDW